MPLPRSAAFYGFIAFHTSVFMSHGSCLVGFFFLVVSSGRGGKRTWVENILGTNLSFEAVVYSYLWFWLKLSFNGR